MLGARDQKMSKTLPHPPPTKEPTCECLGWQSPTGDLLGEQKELIGMN